MKFKSEIFIPADDKTIDKVDEIIVNLNKPVPFSGLPYTDQLRLLSTMLIDIAFDGCEVLYNDSFEINSLLADMVIEKITAEEFKESFINGLKKENKEMFTRLIESRFKRINQGYFDSEALEEPANNAAYCERRSVER